MELQLANIKKYPKSASGYQCIGPCHPKEKISIHPQTLDQVGSLNHPYCAVNEYTIKDKITGKDRKEIIDKCYNVNESGENKTDDILNTIIPYMDFNPQQFLLIFYSIKTYEEGIEYITTKSMNLETKKRIFDCLINVFYSSINIIDNRTIDFVVSLIKKSYLDKFYFRIRKYIFYNSIDKTVKIGKTPVTETDVESNENIEAKKYYIVKEFINTKDVSKFLFKYFKFQQKKDITISIDSMMDDFIAYIINVIRVSIKK